MPVAIDLPGPDCARPAGCRSAARSRPWLGGAVALLLAGMAGGKGQAQAPELRGWWADTFHAALRTPAEVDRLVADARRANSNAIFAEVRKRGDAYYRSRFEPTASDVQAGFDPLAYLIARAHDPHAGLRIEVHAWIVTYNIWNGQSTQPPQSTHPYRRHPDWLTESSTGEKWDGSNYAFDPAHPAVQEHTFNVALDIVTRYDVDGLHFDYVRYAGRDWGYNPVAIAHFNAQTGSTGRPAPDDSWWRQWRRDQVTGLVRRVYLAAAAHKPHVKISAATITWTPSATSFPTWLKSAAWSDVLQDWRSWMEEGILDLNVPMAYFRQETHAAAWSEWSRFAKTSRYGRHLALGVGAYLNTIPNTLAQMGNTRTPVNAAFPGAEGVLVYSFAVPAKDDDREAFIRAVTTTPVGTGGPLFAQAVAPPPMPWKTNGTLCGLTGLVTDRRDGLGIEGGQIELCGLDPGFLVTDANGAFARLLSRPVSGGSGVVVSAPGYVTQFRFWPDRPASVILTNLALDPDTSDLRPLDLRVSPGRNSMVVSWRTAAPSAARVVYGLGAVCGPGGNDHSPLMGTRHSVLVGGLSPGGTDDPHEYWLRVVSESPQHGTNYAHALRVLPALWPTVLGEWDVRLTGDWTFVEPSASQPPQGFWRVTSTTGTPTATATWSAPVEVTGRYDLDCWMQPTSGAFTAMYEVRTPRTNLTLRVNHSSGSTSPVPLATNLFLRRGERPEVRLNNRVASGSASIATGRVRWTYRAGQDPPPPDTLPDWWAEHFFAGTPDPVADPDGDGFSNYGEFVMGTDPTDAASRLRLRLEPAAEGGWQVVFSPRTGRRTYAVEQAADPASIMWERVPVRWPWPAELPSGEWAAPVATPPIGSRFYRLTVTVN